MQSLDVADILGPVIPALLFIGAMSLVREPARRTINALFVAGASGVYISGGGLGGWEVVFAAVVLVTAYGGLRSYALIGVGWLMRASWDLVHHINGHPVWPFMPSSSIGCLVFDSVIAMWFLAGAPPRRPRV